MTRAKKATCKKEQSRRLKKEKTGGLDVESLIKEVILDIIPSAYCVDCYGEDKKKQAKYIWEGYSLCEEHLKSGM